MHLTEADIRHLLSTSNPLDTAHLFAEAAAVRDKVYGRQVFVRGLIEVSNHCKNNCLYCGIRRDARGNQPGGGIARYRLSTEQILDCCQTGHKLGLRTFVLQGGEDAWFTDERLAAIVQQIKASFPDSAVTLSLGERGGESFARLRHAGADRYLLRHETANPAHYALLHPREMSFDNRMHCLHQLRAEGYQVGVGFMVGSPFQTIETLLDDLRFIASFKPEMVGIGPFIPAFGTPFANKKAGSVELTLRLIALIRLICPHALLPATTALGTQHPRGREMALAAGANVIMPNLSPQSTRRLYSIYDNKLATQSEAAESMTDIRRRIEAIGMTVPVDRGDYR